MFDRFTDHARATLGYSRQEAQRFNHDYIGTEHILLGLLQVEGIGLEVLRNLGIDLQAIGAAVEKQLEHGMMAVSMGQLPFTPRAKKVLELALEEASNFGHNYIGTEHLLLGLVREKKGIAAEVLQNVKVPEVREQVLELLGAEPTPGEDEETETPAALPQDPEIFRLHERVSELEGIVQELSERLRKLER